MVDINEIVQEAANSIAKIEDLFALEQIRTSYLGKKGKLTEVLKELGKLDPSERPKVGQAVNEAKERVIALLQQRTDVLKNALLEASLNSEAIDVTLPGRGQNLGSLHPVTKTRRYIEDFFIRMGFTIIEGPEVEDEYHNFTALNIPSSHPARTAHDTFYFPDGSLLRTHTSPVQIRVMKNTRPPLRIITPGRVFRCDSDSTHSPMFHQLEVLMVAEDVNFAYLKWLINKFLEDFFQKKIVMRFRPSYFPFTEPSAEVDIWWELETGSRWLEVLGCGMVHPNVLKNVGIDNERFTGLAFGIGIDRFAMLRYGCKDIRMFFESDLQFLQQF